MSDELVEKIRSNAENTLSAIQRFYEYWAARVKPVRSGAISRELEGEVAELVATIESNTEIILFEIRKFNGDAEVR